VDLSKSDGSPQLQLMRRRNDKETATKQIPDVEVAVYQRLDAGSLPARYRFTSSWQAMLPCLLDISSEQSSRFRSERFRNALNSEKHAIT
jgi:hypothetical protein